MKLKKIVEERFPLCEFPLSVVLESVALHRAQGLVPSVRLYAHGT